MRSQCGKMMTISDLSFLSLARNLIDKSYELRKCTDGLKTGAPPTPRHFLHNVCKHDAKEFKTDLYQSTILCISI